MCDVLCNMHKLIEKISSFDYNRLMKKEKIVRKRHIFWFSILKALMLVFLRITKGYKRINKFDNRKQNVIVLSNHQTDIDCIYISLHFKRTLYFLMTDSVTSNVTIYKLLDHIFAPITKKKGTNDSAAVRKMIQIAKEGGSIAIFPEGNRTYAEFQYPVNESISKLVKILKLPLVLFNMHGGFGVSPRFKNKDRRGKIYGEIKKIIYPDEYRMMSDEELQKLIIDNLKVYDSESNETYKSNRRAEYLEKMLFVCPKCNQSNTLYSKGKTIICKNCGLEVEYTENLHLKSLDPEFKYTILNDWYQMQKKWVKEKEIVPDEIIFKDDNVRLFTSNSNQKRKLLSKGNIVLTDKELMFDNISFKIKDIEISSVISGLNFYFSLVDGSTYLVKGKKRFNPLKYVLMFNKLDTEMKIKKKDEYFTLD